MNRLRELREEAGLRQKDVGERMGMHLSTIGKYELGTSALTDDVLVQFCELYHVSADYLLGRSDLREEPPTITQAELEMLIAYRRADDKSRGMVDYALAEFKQVGSVKAG